MPGGSSSVAQGMGGLAGGPATARRAGATAAPAAPRRRLIDFGNELFATTACFAGIAAIKLVSSLILTRLLYPEAYGIVIILASLGFVVEMLSDIGVVGLMIRAQRGDEPVFVNTLWTLRLLRCIVNFGIVYAIAPLAADWYGTPALADALRVYSVWFLLTGLESPSFLLAMRRKRTRILSYCELGATALATVFVIAWSMRSRDHMGMVYGMLLNQALLALASYAFHREHRVGFALERGAARELFGFAKFVLPSSMITLVLSQFDKFVFLRLFDLHLLGLYGLAASLSGPIESLVIKLSRFVLYPRVAEQYRASPGTLRTRYYRDNLRLFALMSLLPATLGGASALLVQLLYDPRYAEAATILLAFAGKVFLISLASPVEDLLVASGSPRVVLVGNVLRLAWVVPASLLGWWLWGFPGFLAAIALESLPAWLYFTWLQHRRGLLGLRFELAKIGLAALAFALVWMASLPLTAWIAPLRDWWSSHGPGPFA